MFLDRQDAARQLAAEMEGRQFQDPLVLAIPCGGLVTGSVLAEELDAELDVVLSRKLRAPGQPKLAIHGLRKLPGQDSNLYKEECEGRNPNPWRSN